MKKSAFGVFATFMIAGSLLMADGVNQADADETIPVSAVSNQSVSEIDYTPVKIDTVDEGIQSDSFESELGKLEVIMPKPEPVSKVKPESASVKDSKSDNPPNADDSVKEDSPVVKQEPKRSTWDSCIDRVDPNRSVDWRIGSYGYYGQASTNFVLLGNHTPDHRKCAVVYHEWFHTVHARKEGGIENIINTYGRSRIESIADCGALMLGADWVNYGCNNDADRQKAREILGW